MKIQALSSLLFLFLLPISQGQHLIRRNSHIEFNNLTHEQITKRIFEGEREMIAGLRDTSPLLETYFQSLWPGIDAQSPIDDAYFLSKVDFTRGFAGSDDGRRGYQTFLFGQSPASRKVRLNNGDKVAVYPDGYLDMLFVDFEDFDADTYDLTYLQKATQDNRECLVFLVMPRMPNNPGRFKGQIWVETSNFKIIRIKGIFTPVLLGHLRLRRFFGVGSVPLYFHFDSTRQEVAPGTWLPSYSYFDENRTWRQIDRNAATDLHYRGHIFVWGYKNANAGGVTEQSRQSDTLRLEDYQLLAKPGVVEDELNTTIRRILAANNIDVSDIRCRVLLTTPIEILHVEHTIILSRGLLNIVSDDSIVPILLAYEIADIFSENQGVNTSNNDQSTWQKSLLMADRAGYSKGVGYSSVLFSQLAQNSKHIPNLLHARFGLGLLEIANGLPTPTVAVTRAPPLVLRGKYIIDSWNTSLRVQQEPVNGPTTENILSF